MVSSSVRPVKTRIVNCFSWAVSVFHDGMSLDTGTFSGNQKLPVSRSHTSASFSSCKRFQLIAETRSISFTLSVTRTPLHHVGIVCFGHYPWGPTTLGTATPCVGVSCPTPRNVYSAGLIVRVACQYCQV